MLRTTNYIGLFLALTCITGLGIKLHASAQVSDHRPHCITREQREILGHLSIEYLDDGQGALVKTIRVSGTNLQVVDGSGTTNGTKTGVGNLIVGYNELRGTGDNRTGSHNIVGGRKNNYSRFGGLVVGSLNTVAGSWSSVSGGLRNVANADWSSVSGGADNRALGDNSSLSGGNRNTAAGEFASVSGGSNNTAVNRGDSVSGGEQNIASGYSSWVGGGFYNTAAGLGSTVSGGFRNSAGGVLSTVGGGTRNMASGIYSSISGGRSRAVQEDSNWAAGELFEEE